MAASRKSKRAKGRPCMLNPKRQASIVASIRGGNTFRGSAARAGISYATLRLWVNRGEKALELLEETGKATPKSERPFLNFFNAYTRAVADFEHDAVEIWVSHFPNDFRAIRDFLERRNTEDWGKRQPKPETSNVGTVTIYTPELRLPDNGRG